MLQARVLLLNPPTAAISTEPLLNIGYLAAVLRQNGHDVRIVDATAPFRPYSAEEVFRLVSEYRPHFIGVTLTINFIPQSYAFLEQLAKLEIPVVVGGPHPNSRPKESLLHGAQIVCIGEGEETIVELAEYFLGLRPLTSVDGICYQDEKGQPIFSRPRAAIRDLDTIPFPDFADFPIRSYTGSDDPESNPMFWSIFSSRGCPFNCIFCSSHNVFGRNIRFRSAKNVLAEIELLVKRFGIKSVGFQDDEILCRKDRFIEFCDLLSSSRLNLKMSIRTRIDSIAPEILKKAREAGIKRLSFGIESWDDETLRLINKRYDVKTIHARFKDMAEDQPWPVSFNNICGFPWETRKHYENIIREIKKVPREIKIFPNVLIPIPYPQTELYDRYHKQFGFTDWWLKPEKHVSASLPDNERPFFLLFASGFVPMYASDIYWNFTFEQKRDIDWLVWNLFSLFIKSHCRGLECSIVYALCRMSYRIWRINPKIERFFFGWLRAAPWTRRLRGKTRFRDQY